MRVLAIILLFALLANSAMAQCNLNFGGSVKDEDTKELLSGATVRILELQQTAVADSLGHFIFKGLCPGHYDLEITHVGCEKLLTHIHIKDDFTQDFTLPHAKTNLVEVVATGIMVAKKERVLTLNSAALESTRGLSLGESLQKINGISSLQTGTNIYKPVVNGLHSSRVVILNNGIRQEGQQWGGEHAPEIDAYLANKITLVSGASVLKYGGDAIGGLILVEPKLLRALPGVSAEINTAIFSNNRMGVISATVDGASKKQKGMAWRLQATAKRGGNAKTANYWLDNSGITEINASGAVGFSGKKNYTEIFYSYFYNKLAIFSGAHIGNTTDLINAITNVDPPDYIKNAGFTYTIDRPYQNIQHHLLKAKTVWNTKEKGKVYVIGALQYNNRQEYDKKRFASSTAAPQLDLGLTTASLDAYWDFNDGDIRPKVKGSIGINSSFQMNRYGQRLFIPNYDAINFAAFALQTLRIGVYTLEGGLRYDFRSFYNTNTNDGKVFENRNYNSLSSNVNVKRNVAKGLDIALQLNTAWRAPNVNELYSDGLHHGAARIEKGDLALKPERSNAFSLRATYDFGELNMDLNVYHKAIENFIFLSPSFPPQLTIRGAFPVFTYSQTKALLQGIDWSGNYEFTHHFTLGGKASLLYARDKKRNEWLIQMPANRFGASLTYSFNNSELFKQSTAKVTVLHVAQQNRIPATGAIELTDITGNQYFAADYVLPPNAYTLVGLELATQIKVKKNSWTTTLVVSNLLNTAYREYLNAFRYFSDDAGRNVSLKLKIPIN